MAYAAQTLAGACSMLVAGPCKGAGPLLLQLRAAHTASYHLLQQSQLNNTTPASINEHVRYVQSAYSQAPPAPGGRRHNSSLQQSSTMHPPKLQGQRKRCCQHGNQQLRQHLQQRSQQHLQRQWAEASIPAVLPGSVHRRFSSSLVPQPTRLDGVIHNRGISSSCSSCSTASSPAAKESSNSSSNSSDSSSSSSSSSSAGSTSSSGSDSGINSSSGGGRLAHQLQLPPGVVSAATATAAAVSQAARAGAKQVSTLLKLMQQTSLLQAANLQLSSIWQDHSTALTTIAAAAATLGVYQLTYSAAALFVDTTAPGVTYACLGASAAAVGGLGLYLRSGFVVDPERVYHVAMRKLVHHPGLEEVMGTPLAGSPMRVQLVTRGSWFMQETMLPKLRAPRIHMLFPLTGPLKSGVVSLQAKQVGGKYAFKTLLVELPAKTLKGPEGTAAATSAALQAAAAQSTSSSSSGTGSGPAAPAAAAVADADEPARVYIIGKPKSGRGSGSSDEPDGGGDSNNAALAQVPTAQVLLEQLKQPLVFALQQNLVVYETEDELEGELGYDAIPELDPEQLTLLDRAQQGMSVVVRSGLHWSKIAACKAVQLARRSLEAVQQSASKAQQSSKAQPAAGGGAGAGVAAKAAGGNGSTIAAPAAPAPAATPTAAAAVAAEKESSNSQAIRA